MIVEEGTFIMNEKEYFEKALEPSTEFDRYIFAHPEMAEGIPDNALVVFILEDEPEFSKMSIELARGKRENNQPIILVKVEKIIPTYESRLVNPKIESVTTI